jgi:hypothetical protein
MEAAMKRYVVLVERTVETYCVGPFKTEDEAKVFIHGHPPEDVIRTSVIAFYAVGHAPLAPTK